MYYKNTPFASQPPLTYHYTITQKLRFFMKVNAILLVISLFAMGSLYATNSSAQGLQETNVSLGFSGGSLQQAFAKIERETDFRFAYKKQVLSGITAPVLTLKRRSLKQTLDELLKGTGLDYKLLNNSIIIFKSLAPTTETSTNFEEVTGVVRDESGAALPGVSVKVKGKTAATITDVNGTFKIQASPDDILIFSYVGYSAAERPVQMGKSIDISLSPQAGTLDAVVVVGYGTTTKRTNTGSATTVSAKQIGNQPVADPLAALQGRVAGLDISSVTGYPGSGYNVRLRGQNSIT
ncbi:STN domain-containing protein, partial [Pedobacter ginsenosidimutans]|uniref:STN domain-containing protein n=1 Tax=Pedobacter ginsenosidimutans TaxID=687842 RepID=UPI000AD13C1F